jgi:hypothetical protein
MKICTEASLGVFVCYAEGAKRESARTDERLDSDNNMSSSMTTILQVAFHSARSERFIDDNGGHRPRRSEEREASCVFEAS